jgi:hypothetical protein
MTGITLENGDSARVCKKCLPRYTDVIELNIQAIEKKKQMVVVENELFNLRVQYKEKLHDLFLAEYIETLEHEENK